MTRIRMVGRALTIVLAVMAVASVAAEAAKNPVLVYPNGTAATNVTGTAQTVAGSIPTLQTTTVGGAQVECSGGEGNSGTLNTTLEGDGKTSGSGTVTFKKCKTAAGECENKGAGTKEIVGTVAALLVWIGKESNKTIGILAFAAPQSATPGNGKGTLLSFICSGTLVDLEGGFLSLVNRKIGESFTTGDVIANATEGRQEDLTYTENGIEGTDSRYSNQDGGAFSRAGYAGEGEGTFSTIVKVVED
jgi:hypothetical protein